MTGLLFTACESGSGDNNDNNDNNQTEQPGGDGDNSEDNDMEMSENIEFGSFNGPKTKTIKCYSYSPGSDLNDLQYTYTFSYDAESGLLSEVENRWGTHEYEHETYSFTYPEDNNLLTLNCDSWDNSEYDGYTCIMKLKNNGRHPVITSYHIVGDDNKVGTLQYNDYQLIRVTDPLGGYTSYQWSRLTMTGQQYDEMGDGSNVGHHTMTPSALYSNPFFESQVDPTMLCLDEGIFLEPWIFGFAGMHNSALYESITMNDGTRLEFDYEFNGGNFNVNGNNVPLISRIIVKHLINEEVRFSNCYLFEYYK